MSDTRRCPFLVTLCGLPGSGKSTLSQRLLSAAEKDGFTARIVEFDIRLHSEMDKWDQFSPTGWKESRRSCIEDLKQALLGNPGDIVIADDTMHYRSMRAECWKIARLCNAWYAQIYLECPFEVCKMRNSARQGIHAVPEDSLLRLHDIFEAPDDTKAAKYPFDSFTVRLNSAENALKMDDRIIGVLWKQLEMSWKGPLPPMEIESEVDDLIVELTTKTISHQVDIMSRRIVGACMSSIQNECPNDLKRSVAEELQMRRRELLNHLRGIDFTKASPESIENEFKNQCEMCLESLMKNSGKEGMHDLL